MALDKGDASESLLKGYAQFVRSNPKSDKFATIGFDHVEFYCGDATFAHKRFSYGLGMNLVSKSDFSTGNNVHCSYLLQSGSMKMLFSAPLTSATDSKGAALPEFNPKFANELFLKHGFAVRAVAITVDDVRASYDAMILNGGISVLPPVVTVDKNGRGHASIAEIALYGDVVLRLVQRNEFHGKFLPNFEDIQKSPKNEEDKFGRYGIYRFDHIVGNVFSLRSTMQYISQITV